MGTVPRCPVRTTPPQCLLSSVLTIKTAGASEAELREAFKLFDTDGDGVISKEELKGLISKVGGDMSEAEAIAHIKAADADGNMAIDFAEFGKLWEALHGAEEVGLSNFREVSQCPEKGPF